MSVTYLGSLSVAGAIPGLSVALTTVGSALAAFRATVNAQLFAIASASATIDAQASAVAAARIAIRIPATFDLQAQLDASLAINAQLSLDVGDPSLYLSGLLEGLVEVQANLSALIPSVALSGQISASADVSASMSLKIAAIDLQLDLLLSISAALSVIVSALLAIQAALSAAIAATLGALNLYLSFVGALAGIGVNAFLYSGTVANVGVELDAAISADTGFAGALNVHLPFFVYDAANPQAVQGMRLALSTAGA